MNVQVAQWRADTPGCARRIHLNNAGAAFVPRGVLEVMQAHLRREAEYGGYEAAEEAADRVHAAYAHLARLIGARDANIAVVENATVAVALALSAFDFRAGDVLVTTRNDYTSNQLMYLSLGRRLGVEVRRADDTPDGGVDLDSLRTLIAHPRCRAVCVTWVPTNSGLVQPVEAVGELCAAAEVPYVIDACQAVGQLPVDVARLRCDFLATTARKFLRGPRGIGFLYVSDRALDRGAYPLYVDMRGADWVAADEFRLAEGARRFENWEFAYALLLGMGEAARYASEIGVDIAGRRARELAAHTRERLAAVPGVRLMDRGRELCAIVTAELRGWHAKDLVSRLRESGINTSASTRDDGLLDMDEKRVTSVLRISPHYYNTHAEVDAAVDAIEELVRASAAR